MCLLKFPIKLLNIWSEMVFALESQMYKPRCKILIKWGYLVLKNIKSNISTTVTSNKYVHIWNKCASSNGRTILPLPILPILNYIRVVGFYQSCQIMMSTYNKTNFEIVKSKKMHFYHTWRSKIFGWSNFSKLIIILRQTILWKALQSTYLEIQYFTQIVEVI